MFWLIGCAQEGLEGWWVDVHGRVVDEAGAPLSGASVTLVTGEGAAVAQVRTNDEGSWRVPLYGTELDGNVLVGVISAEGKAEGRATWEVNLRSPETTTLRAGPGQTWYTTARRVSTVQLADDAAIGSVSGRVVDAVTGAPVAGAALSLQAGWNAPVGDAAVDSATSSSDGTFSFTGAPGMYTVTVAEGTEWGSARFPALLTGSGGTTTGMVAPPMEAAQLFAAVIWGSTPSDLDLHLSAPKRSGFSNGQYHLWAEEPVHPEDVPEEEQDAWMLRTDSDGYGPESLRVDALAERGDVRLSVFDNDNVSDATTEALSDSGAVLQLWFGEDIPRYWQVSPGEIATLWHPVTVDVQTAVPYVVEEYSFGEDPHDDDAF